MPRATGVIAASHRHDRDIVDTVILDHAQRSASKLSVATAKGGTIEIDLHGAVRLHTDDLLVLEDGTLVEVVAAPEPLIEVRAADVAALARLAWHLGDRHIPVQLLPNRIRAQRDSAVEALLASLGVKVTPIDAPFEPESGAYAPMQARGHADHHGHDHAHCSHDHSHDHAHDHGHAPSHGGHRHD
jgi:urease accessory protein